MMQKRKRTIAVCCLTLLLALSSCRGEIFGQDGGRQERRDARRRLTQRTEEQREEPTALGTVAAPTPSLAETTAASERIKIARRREDLTAVPNAAGSETSENQPGAAASEPEVLVTAPAEETCGGLLYNVPEGSVPEEQERHLFWRQDTNSLRREVAEMFYRAFLAAETSVDIAPALAGVRFEDDPIDEISTIFYSVKDTDPRFFYYRADFLYDYNYVRDEEGKYTFPKYTIRLEFLPGMEEAERRAVAWSEMNERAWEMAREIAAQEESLLGRYMRAHDKLLQYCHYSPTEDYDRNNAYSALLDGETMCVGYALAYQMLTNRLGGDSLSVYGHVDAAAYGGYEGMHNWNLSRLGDRWYHVDVTWDDGSYRGEADVPDPHYLPAHMYFMRAEDQLDTHEIYSFGIPEAPQDLPALFPEAADEAAFRNELRHFFATQRPEQDRLTGLELNLGFEPDEAFLYSLDELIGAAYREAGADYAVEWRYSLFARRFYMQIYPG